MYEVWAREYGWVIHWYICTFHIHMHICMYQCNPSSHMDFSYLANFNSVNTLIISLKKCHWYILYLLHIVARWVSAQRDSILFEAKQEDDSVVLPFVIGFMKTSVIQCSPFNSHDLPSCLQKYQTRTRITPTGSAEHTLGRTAHTLASICLTCSPQAGATGALEQTTDNK